MKTNRWRIFPFLFVLVLSSCTSCDEPDSTVMPAETQSGKNTFGCYVDNLLFVGGFANLMGPKAFNASYSKSSNSVEIEVSGVLNSDFSTGRHVFMSTSSVRVDSAMLIDNVSCYNITDYYPYYITKNSGEIYFTKLYTINKIVSGRFKFAAKSCDCNKNPVDNDSVVVSNGRFDLILEVFD